MRRLYAWVAGAAGGLAAYRFLRRGRGAAVETAPQAETRRATEPVAAGDPRADELRAKLAESRETAPPETSADAEPEAAAEPEPADVEARRRSVHEHGRAAIDEMQGGLEA